MGHLLHGVHEQTLVPYAVAFSLCIGPYVSKCKESELDGGDRHGLHPIINRLSQIRNNGSTGSKDAKKKKKNGSNTIANTNLWLVAVGVFLHKFLAF